MTHRTNRSRSRILALCSVALMATTAFGCTEEVEDIDRTDPNKVEKAALQGVWYFLQTTIDVPPQSSQSFIGSTNFGNNAKVLFEITETWLYVLPTVETVQFAEKDYTKKQIRNFWDDRELIASGQKPEFVELFVGQPLLAFPIEKHFDVIRQYDPATGKQSNVLEENDKDRHWYERKYMRVNWGGNTLLDWAFSIGTQQFSPVDHYVQEVEDPFLRPDGAGENPDKLELAVDEDGRGTYLAFVTRAFVSPSTADWQGYICNPYGLSNQDCAGSVVKIRNSFKRADVTPDYETFYYANNRDQSKFGYFLANRYAYDEYWNLTQALRDEKAQRWNLWQTTWQDTPIEDAQGKRTACFEHEDCGKDENVLDRDTVRCIRESFYEHGYCARSRLKDFADRGLRPIIYHLSPAVQEEIVPWMYKVADQWSSAFKDTVAWLLTLEEAGRYWVKPCSTDKDCTAGRSDVLADQTIDVPQQIPLAPYDDQGTKKCKSGDPVGDVCMGARGCSDTEPCPKGHYCHTEYKSCFTADGDKQVLEPVLIPGPRAATLVVYPDSESPTGGSVIPVRDDFLYKPGSQDAIWQVGATDALVRFVHANPKDKGPIQLTIDGAAVGDPMEYQGAGTWLRQTHLAPAGKEVTLAAGGASKKMKLETAFNYVVAYVDTDLVVAGTKLGTASGVRFLHAMPAEGPVDAGATGVRASQNLAFGELGTYLASPFDTVRATVVRAGTEGDVTCFHTLHEGRCVGWAADWSDDLRSKYEENLQNLPDMFVLCENQYDPAAAATKHQDARDRGHLETYHDGRYATKGKDPYAAKGGKDFDGYYNPCEQFVVDPTKLKKIGDIRYNYQYWVAEDQAASPLGYGPSAGDPDTGELIWGTAYVYGAPMLTYGQYATDLVNLINGVYDGPDIMAGSHIRDFVLSKGNALPMDNTNPFGDDSTKYPGEKMQDFAATYDRHIQFEKDGRVLTGDGQDPMKDPDFVRFLFDKDFQKQLMQTVPSVEKGYTQSRMDLLRGTHIEDLMINEEVKTALAGAELQNGQGLTAELREQLSPASWGTGTAIREHVHRETKKMMNGPCVFEREFAEPYMYGLAKEFSCTEEEMAQWKAGTGTKLCGGDDLRWEIMGRIHLGTQVHEVGHTVGLRHNFSASADLFNYHDKWYEVREKEYVYCHTDLQCDEDFERCWTDCTQMACPAGLTCIENPDYDPAQKLPQMVCVDGAEEATGVCAEINFDPSGKAKTPHEDNVELSKKFVPRTYYTEQEALGKLAEYQHSSTMDYGARPNSDIHGLGKYDRAAIKYGYGKLVEVYRDTKKLRGRISELAKITGMEPSRFAYPLDTYIFVNSIYSPFYWLEHYIGVQENLDRITVPEEKVRLEHNMQQNYHDEEWNWSYIEVPYKYDGDEWAGNLGIYTWDCGVDVGEMVATAMNSINEYYLFDAFMREKLFSGAENKVLAYFSRVSGRWLSILGDAGRYNAIYDNIFRDRPWYDSLVQNPFYMRTLNRASKDAFNHLAQMLAAPAPGSFVRGEDGVYRNVGYEPGQGELNVPVGSGKFPYTQYLSNESYGWENHVLWVGSFWLKLGAMMQLTDSTFYSAANWVGEQLDIGRAVAVGFNTLYQREMTNLLGGIVAGAVANYSNVVETDETGAKVFRPRDLFNPDLDKGKDVLEPGLNNLTMKLYAAAYGLANLPAGFDPSFTDSMAVFLKGSGNEYSLATGGAGVKKAEFHDPFGAKTYVAYRPNYDAKRLAPAYELVTNAQKTREKWEQATGAQKQALAKELKGTVEVLDILRELHVVLGNLVY